VSAPRPSRIAAGGDHACAIGSAVSCWGADASGELIAPAADPCGNPLATTCLFHPTVSIPSSANVADVALGRAHLCVLETNGNVSCAGDTSKGQLGDGSTQPRATLGPVPGIANAKAIAAGGDTTCVLLADATMRCWGDDGRAQCGDGGAVGTRPMPVTPLGLMNVTAISVGDTNACAVLGDGSVWCWGESDRDEIGSAQTVNACGFTKCVAVPTQVPGVANATRVAVDGGHVCAIVTGGALYCWGMDAHGELGYPGPQRCLGTAARPCSNTPTAVPGLAGVLEVAMGPDFTCARMAGSDVSCWGNGTSGQLGDGTLMTRTAPAKVTW
jgi:alpha-tubulin suppressor-like RCC1 family protein